MVGTSNQSVPEMDIEIVGQVGEASGSLDIFQICCSLQRFNLDQSGVPSIGNYSG